MRRPIGETLLIVVIIAVLVLMGIGWRSCTQRGGTYVRGALWMVCVK